MVQILPANCSSSSAIKSKAQASTVFSGSCGSRFSSANNPVHIRSSVDGKLETPSPPKLPPPPPLPPVSALVSSHGFHSSADLHFWTGVTAAGKVTTPHCDWVSSAASRYSREAKTSQQDTAQETRKRQSPSPLQDTRKRQSPSPLQDTRKRQSPSPLQDTRKRQSPSPLRRYDGGDVQVKFQVCDIQGLFIPPSSRSSGRKGMENKTSCSHPPSRLVPHVSSSHQSLKTTDKSHPDDHTNRCNEDFTNHNNPTNNKHNNNNNNNDNGDTVTTLRDDPTTRPSLLWCSAVVPSVTTRTHMIPDVPQQDSVMFTPEAVTSPESSISMISSGSSVGSSQTESRGNSGTSVGSKSRRVVARDSSCDLALTYFRESINVDIISTLNDLRAAIENLTISLSMVSEECRTLRHTLTQVEGDCTSAKSQVGSLQGKVGNLESVLRLEDVYGLADGPRARGGSSLETVLIQMKDAADKRRKLEQQHAEALAQLRDHQAALHDASKATEKDRKGTVEVVEALQSKIRELEKKAEVQNLRHEELMLELQSLKRAQHGSPKNATWSRSGSLSADLQSPDSAGDITPGLNSLNSISSGVYTNTSSSFATSGSAGLIGSSPLPGNVENASTEIDRIMAKIEQDNKILAELDKSRSTIGPHHAGKHVQFMDGVTQGRLDRAYISSAHELGHKHGSGSTKSQHHHSGTARGQAGSRARVLPHQPPHRHLQQAGDAAAAAASRIKSFLTVPKPQFGRLNRLSSAATSTTSTSFKTNDIMTSYGLTTMSGGFTGLTHSATLAGLGSLGGGGGRGAITTTVPALDLSNPIVNPLGNPSMGIIDAGLSHLDTQALAASTGLGMTGFSSTGLGTTGLSTTGLGTTGLGLSSLTGPGSMMGVSSTIAGLSLQSTNPLLTSLTHPTPLSASLGGGGGGGLNPAFPGLGTTTLPTIITTSYDKDGIVDVVDPHPILPTPYS
ncbi:hypothetical protein Pmani_012436 [Petrolisthes manimaculis]|uniref:Uncharacterized protein n=1 Tax=Petrolisthes manimaculis TaxID=1843537 RepID=A0AAE1UA91_9EUCA|nr:hypothetical protein Pmani_012436 [Petrolisthes manimaculis]